MPAPVLLSSLDTDDLFAPLSGFTHVLAAVSGGVDSTVLLHLLTEWRQQQAGPREANGLLPFQISVACVDHGLRPDSAREALSVKAKAEALGCAGAILLWSGEKPSTRLQEKARETRYHLLCAHARAIGAEAIVLAHHADDQAETLLMRLAAGSGPEGLSGMRVRSERDGLVLLRPFLTVPKSVLLATAQARHWDWHEDPSNDQDRFERVRLRKMARVREAVGLTSKRLGRLAERLARQQEAIDLMVEECWTRLVRCDPSRIQIEAGFWACPVEIRLRLLARAVHRLRPDIALRLERLETLQVVLQDLAQSGQKSRRTIGGCVISLSAGGVLSLTPEPARRG